MEFQPQQTYTAGAYKVTRSCFTVTVYKGGLEHYVTRCGQIGIAQQTFQRFKKRIMNGTQTRSASKTFLAVCANVKALPKQMKLTRYERKHAVERAIACILDGVNIGGARL